jgi:hypothetical protein
MPTPTPQITLTFDLLDYSGNKLGSATQPAWLRIALCNFGANLPRIPSAGVIGKVSSWFVDVPYYGTTGTVLLWGNDVIVPGPDLTYYAISVLDAQRNVVQTALYQFDGTLTIDLSNATPFDPTNPAALAKLEIADCTGAVPGTTYTAPGKIVPGGVFYNGIQLPQGKTLPILSYTISGGTTINLNFTTQAGTPNDRITALCIVL